MDLRRLKSFLLAFLHERGFSLTKLRTFPYYSIARVKLAGIGSPYILTVLDVGANIGNFARTYRATNPNAMIHCFEPLPSAYASLSQYAATSKGKVAAYNHAVGAEDGEIHMYEHLSHSPSSSLLKSTSDCTVDFPQTENQASITVKMGTIDSLISKYSIDLKDKILLKMDVQGYELNVLRGATQTLPRVDLCMIEIMNRHWYEGQSRFIDVANFMSDMNFKFVGVVEQITDDEGNILYFDALFSRNR